MRVWMPLYGMVWLVLVEFLTVLLIPPSNPARMAQHTGFGFGIVLLAYINLRNLNASLAPARTKRIARASFQMAVGGAIAGAFLYAGVTPSLGLVPGGPVFVLHLLFAFALITQAASIATSFDMWEEKESVDSAPGPAPALDRALPSSHSRAY